MPSPHWQTRQQRCAQDLTYLKRAKPDRDRHNARHGDGANVHQPSSPHDRHEELPRAHSQDRERDHSRGRCIGVPEYNPQDYQQKPQWRAHQHDPHEDDANAHHANSPCDHRV